MPRKKVLPEPEVEVSIGPVTTKMERATACCLASGAALILTVMLINVAFGVVPGVDGFARAQETKRIFDERLVMIQNLAGLIEKNTKSTKAVIFTGQINNTQRAYCAALKAMDQPAIALAGDQLTGLLIEYQKLTNDDFPIRPCP